MRRSILLIAIVAIAAGLGPQQKPGKKAEKKVEPLPPLNAKVEAFARAHLGKSVGDGICVTLAIEALREAGAKKFFLSDPRGDYAWGTLVPNFKDVLPGDILQFRDAVFDGKRSTGRGKWVSWHQEYPHHTAVVAKVESAGKLISVYHQNVTREGRPASETSNVREDELRMDSLKNGGWVRAYRPVVADGPESR